MFCTDCGTKVDKNAKFCSNCGSKKLNEKKLSKVSDKEAAWGKWLMLFLPTFLAIKLANNYFGFAIVFPLLIALLVTIVLHQHFFKGKSWYSILWGKEKE